MAEILEFKKPEPEGPVWVNRKTRCLACEHEWLCVCEVGTRWPECPKCKAPKGVFMEYVVPKKEGNKVFACGQCNACLWTPYIMPNYPDTPCLMCAECGHVANGLDLFP